MKTRAGRYVAQPTGYKAFIPASLPPDPPLQVSPTLLELLSHADRALARLDGTAENLPNADLFVAMYVRKEAVLSSQIEGTQASLVDILEYEAKAPKKDLPQDVNEVYNYVRALNFGLKRLESLPLSLRLVREIHKELVRGVRGGERTPGEFRRSQNWIGPPGCTLSEAVFVPPPVPEMHEALDNLEKSMHDPTPLPPLIRCAMIHAQFETIHPFLDGNGRVGRLLITFMLCAPGVLKRPLLYLSLFFKKHREEYYNRLMAVRDEGDWEGWIDFFLRGVRHVSVQATELARTIMDLQRSHQETIHSKVAGSMTGLRLLESLFRSPVISANQVASALSVSYPTANQLIGQFEDLGLLKELTGRKRNRFFSYQPYLHLFEQIEEQSAEP
jgi:Fic family protein